MVFSEQIDGRTDIDACANACNSIGTCWGFYFDTSKCTIWKEPTARSSVEGMGFETYDASASYAKCLDTDDATTTTTFEYEPSTTFADSPYWGSWSQWSDCSVDCGSGLQTRSRECIGEQCDGDSSETQQCTLEPCDDDTTTGGCQESDDVPGYEEILGSGMRFIPYGFSEQVTAPTDIDACANACNLIGTCWGFYFDMAICTIWKEPNARTSVEAMGFETYDASASYAKCPDTDDATTTTTFEYEPSTTFAAPEQCKSWCNSHTAHWILKCNFDMCGGCSECDLSYNQKSNCMNWCNAHASPWIPTKCGWEKCA